MANTKSAAKRAKTSEKRRVRNKQVRSRVRTTIRRFKESLQEEDDQVVEERLRTAVSTLDRAVSKGVLHKNNAARKKSQLYRAARERDIV